MLDSGRDIFQQHLYANYDPIPSRCKAPEVGETIAKATWPIVKDSDILRDVWFAACKRWASEFLKNPPPEHEELQEAFDFYKTPKAERIILESIGHRRMESPLDGAMIDLVNPEETSSEELFRLADKLEAYGNQCVDRSRYIRQLAKLRARRGL
jgi:hypothetical protein